MYIRQCLEYSLFALDVKILRILILILLASFSFTCQGAPENFVAAVKPTSTQSAVNVITEAFQQDTKLDFQAQHFWIDEAQKIPKKVLFIEFSNKQIQLIRERYFINNSGKLVWLGSIEGYPNSVAGFTLSSDGLSGSLAFDDKLLQLVRDTTGQLWLKNRSADMLNNPVDDVIANPRLSEKAEEPTNSIWLLPSINVTQPRGFTNDETITLLIYYPVTALETSPSLLDLIELDVAQANQAFENNQLATRLVVSKILPLDIRETDDALNQMQSRSGPFANLEYVRQKYAADFVHFYVPNLISIAGKRAYCGVANYAAFPEGYISSYSAVGMTSINCAGGLTFAHEIGHNMGARHDRHMENGGDSRQSNYGYINLQQGVRTIMSYPDGCSGNQVACQRIPYFSTPNLTPDANTIGIADGDPESADNSAMLATSGHSLANLIGPQRPVGLQASNGNDANTIQLSWHEYPGADRYRLTRLTALKESDGSIRCLPGFIAIYESFEMATNYYEDKDVDPKNQYCYWLQAINDKLLPGAQISPDSFAESGYIGSTSDMKIDKIADKIVSGNDHIIEVPLPLSANLSDDSINFFLEQHSFSTPPDIELFYDEDDAPSLIITNSQRLNGNGRIIVWTSNNAEVFNFSYIGFETPLPIISQVESQTIPQNESFVIDINVKNASSEHSTPLLVYSDNHEIVSPQQMHLERLDTDGNYRLNIVRDTLKSGSTLISLVAGNSEESVTESFLLTYERELSRKPIVQDVTIYLSSNGDIYRKFPAFDPDLDPLEYVISKQPEQGTLTLRKGGDFVYEATREFTQDSFEFYVIDPISGASDVATVMIKNHVNRLLSPIQKMTAMHGNVMLLTHEGDVWSWGSNQVNTAGLGRNIAPVWTPQLSSIADIADMGAATFTYYLKQDGSLWFIGQVDHNLQSIYVDELTPVDDQNDWRKIDCYKGQCILLKDDGSVWTMGMFIEDNITEGASQTSQIQHYFSQQNPLYHWQDMALNNNGGVLQNSKGQLWSWVAEGQEPQGREWEVANFAQISVPQGIAKLKLGNETGILGYGDSTMGWGKGLANLTGQQEEYRFPEVIDTAAWQSVSSDSSVFAKVSQGKLSTWAARSKSASIMAHMARGENPDPNVNEVNDQNDWLEVFIPSNDLLFAIKQDGSLWTAGAVYGPINDQPPYDFAWSGGPALGVGEIDRPLYQLTLLSNFPLGKLGTEDTDYDGTLDYQDNDDDSDGIEDVVDARPYDTDNDGLDNTSDSDDDNDGVLDAADPYPFDPTLPVVEPPIIKKGGSLWWFIGVLLIVITQRAVFIQFGDKSLMSKK